MQRRELATALIASTTAAASLGSTSQVQVADASRSTRSPAEVDAGITPTDYSYSTLNVMRYGASEANNGEQNAAAFKQCIAVLARHDGGEMLIPAGKAFHIGQAVFNNMSNFTVCCDGALLSSAEQPGAVGRDERSSHQGIHSILKVTGCTRFRIHGNGWLDPGFVEPMYIVSCSDFDVALDARGTGQNTSLSGFFIQRCSQFRLHDMTVDSITLQRMSNTTEIYDPWLNNIQLLQCHNFKIDGWMTRKAGMNGIYIAACYDFDLINNIAEFNAGSGIQLTWIRGVSIDGISTPVRYKINNNVFRYNQADGIDAANSSGSIVTVNAQFNGNLHSYNGWRNCDPANGGGADGSGVGTFIDIAGIEAVGNVVIESHNAGIYAGNCHNWRIANNTITKLNVGTAQAGVSINASSNGTLSNNDIVVATTVAALAMQPVSDVKVFGNSFIGGGISLANGSYQGCKFSQNFVNTPTVVNVVFDFLDNNIIVTGTSQDGLRAANVGVKIQRNTVSAPNHCVVVPGLNYVEIEGNQCTSASGSGIYVSNSVNTVIRGNTCTATDTAAIAVHDKSSATELSNNRASSSRGNSFLVDSTCANSNKWGNITINGVASFNGTYGLNY